MKQGIFQSTVSTEKNDYQISFEDVREKVAHVILMKDIHLSDFLIIVLKEYIQRYGNGLNTAILEATQIPIVNLPTNKFNAVSNLSFTLRENHEHEHFLILKESLSVLLELLVDLSVDK